MFNCVFFLYISRVLAFCLAPLFLFRLFHTVLMGVDWTGSPTQKIGRDLPMGMSQSIVLDRFQGSGSPRGERTSATARSRTDGVMSVSACTDDCCTGKTARHGIWHWRQTDRQTDRQIYGRPSSVPDEVFLLDVSLALWHMLQLQ